MNSDRSAVKMAKRHSTIFTTMLKRKIPLPTLPAEHPGRVLDCELYLEPIFDEMVDCALAKG